MKRIAIIVLALLLVLTTSALAYTPGTYEGSAFGQNGQVPVKTTFTEDKIIRIEIGENVETPGVSDWPIALIPHRIIENQSLAVDTVTGATRTSNAIITAVKDAAEQAGGDMDALTAAAEKAVADIEETADIIVVGGGGAGLAAAVAASDHDASVILMEKTGFLGGNSIVSGGIYNAADPELQVPLGIEDSPEFHAKQTWEGGDKVADIELVNTLCFNALDGYHWLQSLGMEFDGQITQGVGSLYRRTHKAVLPNGTGYIKAFRDNLARKSNFTLLMETAGESLVLDDAGRVVGVEGTGKAGNKVVLHANKAVILATGGFAGNVEMRVKYCQGEKWPELGKGLITSNMPAIQGDGIRMAQAAGAALRDMDQIQLLQVCNPWTGVTSDVFGNGGVDACIYVNQEGNRFVREDGRRDVISAAILAQTDGRMYSVYNHIAIPDPDTTKALGGRTWTALEEEGLFGYVHADTLEELAEKIGADPANLVAAVDNYNAHVKSGEVDEFGRELLTTVLEEGPWYAHPRAPAAHHTMGGVVIDTGCHVMNEAGEAIPGLFAAGEVTGGIHGGNRLGGNAIVDFTVFGRIAGTNAAVE